MVCPFHDEFVVHPTVATTASAEGVHAAKATPVLRQRDHAQKEISPNDGAVTHGPLYFEDPFEDKGSEDGKFAWTGEDYLQWWYWRGRFLLNAVALPVSAVVTPPWVVMVSDGRLSRQALGYDHDAERWAKPLDEPAAPPEAEAAAQSSGG